MRKAKKATHPWKKFGWLTEQDVARATQRERREMSKPKKRKG